MSVEQTTAPRYPEHEKLAKVSDESQAIGLFLDSGLHDQGLALYEQRLERCECEDCERESVQVKEGHEFHSDAEEFKGGVAYYLRRRPALKSIQAILAEHFGIDQDKIDAEKDQMLADIRGES